MTTKTKSDLTYNMRFDDSNDELVAKIDSLKGELEASREMVFLLLAMQGGKAQYCKPGELLHHAYEVEVEVDGDMTYARILDGAESLCHYLNNYIEHYRLGWDNTPDDVQDILATLLLLVPDSEPSFVCACELPPAQSMQFYSCWSMAWESDRYTIGYDPIKGVFFTNYNNLDILQDKCIEYADSCIPARLTKRQS